MKPLSIADYRTLSRRRLPRFLFEYIDGGANGETTLRRNVRDLEVIALRQRVLADVSALETSTEIFGQNLTLPVILGPVGIAGMNARRGEVQAARAAVKFGVPFCLSTVSVCSYEEVMAAVGPASWFQLYMMRDRVLMRHLLATAEDSGCKVLVLTVDMPVPGTRHRDYRSGLAGAPGFLGTARRALQAAIRPQWAYDVGLRGRPHVLGNVAPALGDESGLEDFFLWMSRNFDPSVSWRDLDAIRAAWPGVLIVKGILDPADAVMAADAGVDAIVVSNHGGRQLDGAPSTAHALTAVARAVGERLVVLADGGVRSGADVVKMLALGAKAVLLGRAWAYALAARGEVGVTHMLGLIEADMRVTMALTGCRTAEAIDHSILIDS